MCVGQIKSSFKSPTIQKTHLGWIIAGNINNDCQGHKKSKYAIVNNIVVTSNHSDINLELALSSSRINFQV